MHASGPQVLSTACRQARAPTWQARHIARRRVACRPRCAQAPQHACRPGSRGCGDRAWRARCARDGLRSRRAARCSSEPHGPASRADPPPAALTPRRHARGRRPGRARPRPCARGGRVERAERLSLQRRRPGALRHDREQLRRARVFISMCGCGSRQVRRCAPHADDDRVRLPHDARQGHQPAQRPPRRPAHARAPVGAHRATRWVV
mmetsp:Transcript_22768/g.71298  ORF Transcript_22768/g.71298 Transcript_22768/m.71298 type:complete len:207 (+) Transcript_22768:142-762(+)